MTKGTRSCAYCSTVVEKVEKEHVFPESWYPDGTPRDRMVLVPACRKCNGDFGRIEERMLLPLALALPDDADTQSILARATRGLDPSAGRNVQDIYHRHARAQGLMR
jgi:hypothetical protein